MVINGGSGLAALEFADCLHDSPEFRENLYKHEKELDKTSQQIKRIIKGKNCNVFTNFQELS